MTALLQLQGVSKSYQLEAEDVHVLEGIDLSLEVGELVCLYGASGSGKSTLLNVASTVDVPDSGSVLFREENLTLKNDSDRSRHRLHEVGIVFQDDNLVPDFTAAENVELILRARGISVGESKEFTAQALSSLGIGDLGDRLPRQLSGGQAQRVGIARAIAGGKQLVIADEPTGALDRRTTRGLFAIFEELVSDLSITVLMGTHDPLAAKYATRVFDLVDGELVAR